MGGGEIVQLAFFLPGGGLGGRQNLGEGGWSKLGGGGALDSVYFPIYPKNFPPAAGQKSIKIFLGGGLGGDPAPPPPQVKKTLLYS